MGNTAEQHRSSIGSFAARIASSGWTKSSAGPKSAAFLLSDLVQKILLEGECSKIRQKLLWSIISICLDAVLLCLAAPTILQIIDGGMIDKRLVQNEATSSNIEMQHIHQENLGNLAFSLAVLLKVLLVSGDIETNPGPTTPTLEGKDFDGINHARVISQHLYRRCAEMGSCATERVLLGTKNIS